MVNVQPALTTGTYAWDKLLGADMPIETRSITLEQRAGSLDAEYARGRLLNQDVDGKWHIISSTETTVALDAAGEVIKNNLATTDLQIPFKLAKPPIPGTVHLATTADASATVLKELGVDNGEGRGVGADGWFTIDYETGAGIAYLATAPTATNDLKAGYKYRAVDDADAAETQKAMPKAILAEDVPGASVVAGDVVTTAYVAGEFNRSALLGYSAGYEPHLNRLGIFTK